MSEQEIIGRSAVRCPEPPPEGATDPRWVRRAGRVISRISKSRSRGDRILRERINRALTVIDNTRQSETAFVNNQPVDNVQRLAARVVRQMNFQ